MRPAIEESLKAYQVYRQAMAYDVIEILLDNEPEFLELSLDERDTAIYELAVELASAFAGEVASLACYLAYERAKDEGVE